jgi:hypothetical protein
MAVQEWVNSSRGHFLKNNTNMTVPCSSVLVGCDQIFSFQNCLNQLLIVNVDSNPVKNLTTF